MFLAADQEYEHLGETAGIAGSTTAGASPRARLREAGVP